jgi:O-antigen ligase
MLEAPSLLQAASQSALPRVTWGLFLLLLIISLLVAFGAPTGTTFLLTAFVAILIAWRYPYAAFYTALATMPLLGIIISISTGQFTFGERAFGGSIDVSLGELIAGAVLVAWALRVLTLWHGRRDWNWKPWLPLGVSYGLLVIAHLASVFSPADPDGLLVAKYALRPVFVAYILSVAVTVNFVRSRRRLLTSLGILTVLGLVFAFDGFRSLFFFGDGSGLHYARPLPMLGVSPIGENHNVLAELLLFTAPVALAFAVLTRHAQARTYAMAAAVFMTVIALFTFARSAWIALTVEAAILFGTVWRGWAREHVRKIALGFILFLPVAGVMLWIVFSPQIQGSTDARAALTGIAIQLFQESPLLGIGAGAFPEHVAQTRAFVLDFGSAMDSHGIIQKLLSETGLIGMAAFLIVIASLVSWLRIFAQRITRRADVAAYLYLVTAVAGAFTYQLFNTTYWTAKLWLPVGIALAAGHVLSQGRDERDPDFLAVDHD